MLSEVASYWTYDKAVKMFLKNSGCQYRIENNIKDEMGLDVFAIPMTEFGGRRSAEYVFSKNNVKLYFHFHWKCIIQNNTLIPEYVRIDSIYVGREEVERRRLSFFEVHCSVFELHEIIDLLSEKSINRDELLDWLVNHTIKPVT